MVLGHWDSGVGSIVLGALTPVDYNLSSRVRNGKWRGKTSCWNNTNMHSLLSTDQCHILDPRPWMKDFFWGQLMTERIKIDKCGIHYWYYPYQLCYHDIELWIIRKWKSSDIGASSPELLRNLRDLRVLKAVFHPHWVGGRATAGSQVLLGRAVVMSQLRYFSSLSLMGWLC